MLAQCPIHGFLLEFEIITMIDNCILDMRSDAELETWLEVSFI